MNIAEYFKQYGDSVHDLHQISETKCIVEIRSVNSPFMFSISLGFDFDFHNYDPKLWYVRTTTGMFGDTGYNTYSEATEAVVNDHIRGLESRLDIIRSEFNIIQR